ncbi:MAG: DUF3368 domain-containing protein [Verrucomicrobia bacterium]|nr:DUF3368 domain-containing protein [Verrucomicrobiota bacterium]
MQNKPSLVINTSPLVALVAGLDDFRVLAEVATLIVPGEVLTELTAGADRDHAAVAVRAAEFCQIRPEFPSLPPIFQGVLGPGEAAVLHTALTESVGTVVIDERKGRRWAALHGLRVTGTLGILLALRRRRLIPSMKAATDRLVAKGIHLDPTLVSMVLEEESRL